MFVGRLSRRMMIAEFRTWGVDTYRFCGLSLVLYYFGLVLLNDFEFVTLGLITATSLHIATKQRQRSKSGRDGVKRGRKRSTTGPSPSETANPPSPLYLTRRRLSVRDPNSANSLPSLSSFFDPILASTKHHYLVLLLTHHLLYPSSNTTPPNMFEH